MLGAFTLGFTLVTIVLAGGACYFAYYSYKKEKVAVNFDLQPKISQTMYQKQQADSFSVRAYNTGQFYVVLESISIRPVYKARETFACNTSAEGRPALSAENGLSTRFNVEVLTGSIDDIADIYVTDSNAMKYSVPPGQILRFQARAREWEKEALRAGNR